MRRKMLSNGNTEKEGKKTAAGYTRKLGYLAEHPEQLGKQKGSQIKQRSKN